VVLHSVCGNFVQGEVSSDPVILSRAIEWSVSHGSCRFAERSSANIHAAICPGSLHTYACATCYVASHFCRS
jgi:hypothetical protein